MELLNFGGTAREYSVGVHNQLRTRRILSYHPRGNCAGAHPTSRLSAL